MRTIEQIEAELASLLKEKEDLEIKSGKENAVKEIARLTAESYSNIEKAKELADRYSLSFDFGIDFQVATYFGTGSKDPNWYSSSDTCEWDDSIVETGTWRNSSDYC